MELNVMFAIVQGLEAQKARIEKEILVARKMYQKAVLGRTLSRKSMSTWMEETASVAAPPKAVKTTRTISPAGRARIAAAQRKRWSKVRRQKKAA